MTKKKTIATAPSKQKRERAARVSVPELFRLWHEEINTTDICTQLGISKSAISRLAKKYGLPRRKNGNNGKTKNVDPSPEEIAQLALETRAKWSDKELDDRYQGPSRRNWCAPAYTYNASSGSFLPK
jgi:hypothetical protein